MNGRVVFFASALAASLVFSCGDDDDATPACVATMKEVTVDRSIAVARVEDLDGASVKRCIDRACVDLVARAVPPDGGSGPLLVFGSSSESSFNGLVLRGGDGAIHLVATFFLEQRAADATTPLSFTVTPSGSTQPVVDVEGDVRWSSEACNRRPEPSSL